MAGIAVLVVHRQRLFAKAVAEALQASPSVGSARAAPAGSATGTWDVVVTDEVTALALPAAHADSPALAIVAEADARGTASLVLAGVSGVCTVDQTLEDLTAAVVEVAGGDVSLPHHLLGPVVRLLLEGREQATAARQRLDTLTARERQVLELLSLGLGRAAIAQRLTLTQNTVRTHVGHVLQKLSLHSQLEARAVGRLLLEQASGQEPLAGAQAQLGDASGRAPA